MRKPTVEDFHLAWEKEIEALEKPSGYYIPGSTVPIIKLKIPPHIDIHQGSFSHQGKAIEAWETSGRRGFLAMATGSGKTITALAAATKLQEEVDTLLVIISAPYKPLVSQWLEEVNTFGVRPIPVKGSQVELANSLDFAVKGLQSKVSKVEVMVVTENFLTSKNFRQIFDAVPESISTLLIADEAHNLGKKSFLENTPNRFDFRLGLSATPVRQYDPNGTNSLFAYFGKPVFEFSLGEAIGLCLVPYKYYMHKVELTIDELDKWKILTEKLRRNSFKGDADVSEAGDLSTEIKKLLIARRTIIESAENKINILRNLLGNRSRDTVKHVLVYATDKKPSQLLKVNEMLQNDLNFTIHQLTSEETRKSCHAASILQGFALGDYNVVTCKRVLDEGVDIPQAKEAYLLASNTIRRQWIQRRGRVLRKCDAVHKQMAHLHDFIVIPPVPSDIGSRVILEGELERAREFAELSANGGSVGGPFDRIEKIMNTMFN